MAKERENAPDHLLVSRLYSLCRKNKIDYYWQDDLTFLLRSNSWLLQTDDKRLRRQLNIQADYDMFWAFRKYYRKELPPMTRVQYLDLKTYLPGDILTKVDRVSMAASLETRVPFLSRKLIEFSFSLSEEDRCPNGMQKGLLKKTYEKAIGRNITYRRKMGFCIPVNFYGEKNLRRSSCWKIFGSKKKGEKFNEKECYFSSIYIGGDGSRSGSDRENRRRKSK